MLLKFWFHEHVSQDCSEVKSPTLPSSAETKNGKTELKLQKIHSYYTLLICKSPGIFSQASVFLIASIHLPGDSEN